MRVALIDGSPSGGGHTERVLRAVGDAAATAARGDVELASLATGGAGDPVAAALEAAHRADALVLGSPMYRASFAHPLKVLLDRMPRGMWGESTAPLTGRAVAIVGTGATWHHFLGLDDLRSVLAGFFAAYVIPPGVYVPHEGFDGTGELLEPFAGQAALAGRALAELAAALERSTALRAVTPQA